MASVSIDGRFSILTKDKNLGSGGVQLSVPSGGQIAVVRIDPQNFAAFCSIRGIEVSEKFSAEVGVFPAPMYKKLSPEVQAEVTDLRMRMSEALRTCLSYAKYHLSLYFVGEGLFSVVHENVQFDDQPHKHSFPSDIIITGSVTSFTPISPDVQGLLQASIDMQSRPFSAMRHLHKAKQEALSRYKVIDATIAAELAVKEAISRKSEDASKLITELPSPPLTKLYGSVLEKFFGVRSPYLKELKKGMELRNSLVHNPDSTKLDDQEVINYVDAVEAAIIHLMYLLYPNDRLISLRARERGIGS